MSFIPSKTLVPSLAVLALLLAGGASATSGDEVPTHATVVTPPATIIDTLAGGGHVGDGGAAKSARLSLPGGISEAPNGDLIVVDFGNHRVRIIDHRTKIIKTLAGTGEAGYNGDGIPASQAQLSRPEYAVFGPNGDLFIADSYNNRVRKIDHRTGLISTVAGTGERGFSGDGGPATAAKLHFPEGIAVDRLGNLFISDTVNRFIRRVDARTGIIATYAGTGETGVNPEGTPALQAKFLRLARIAIDQAGNLYVADSPSHRILVIDARTRLVRTFAGTGKLGFSGDDGPAVDAQISYAEGMVVAPNQDIYFADVGNHRVRRIDAKTRVITTVAGTGEKGFSGDGGPAIKAQLWSPGRVWVDHQGNILIADILNARIRRVDARTKIIETIAGTGDWGDGGPARDALLSVPGDIAYSNGKVYIADYGTRRIRCVDLATGIISTVAGGGTQTGEGIPATDADFLLPEGIAVDSRRHALYIADNISNKVWVVDLGTGILHTLAGGKSDGSDEVSTARSAHLRLPSALTVGPDGQLYIGDFGRHRVLAVDPVSGTMHALHGAKGDSDLLDIAVTSLDAGAQGLFLLTHGSSDVRLFDPRSGTFTPMPQIDALPAALSGDSQIIDIAAQGSYVYLADALAHRVLRLDLRTSTVTVIAGSGIQGFSGDGGPADRASLFQPGGIAVSDDGRELFIADTKNHRVRRVRLLDGAAKDGGIKNGEARK
jgi:DNA-binding beta-propeller fold protein YncE